MTPAIPTDLVTPLGAYLRLRGPGRASFLLESVDQGRLGRYSLIGSGTRIVDIHEAERLPESCFVVADRLVRFDHVLGVAEVLKGDPDEIAALLETPIAAPPGGSGFPSGPIRRFPEQAEHEAGVVRCKEYITAGDAFQIVLSQRFALPYAGDPVHLYRALRFINPSPYMFCLRLPGGFSLVGSSPEVHVKVTDGHVQIRPIAGTRKRGDTPEADEALRLERCEDEMINRRAHRGGVFHRGRLAPVHGLERPVRAIGGGDREFLRRSGGFARGCRAQRARVGRARGDPFGDLTDGGVG